MTGKCSISTKISVLVFCSVVFTLLFVFSSLYFSMSGLWRINKEEIGRIVFEERKSKLKELITNAAAAIKASESKSQAKEIINNMRYGKDERNYIFVFDDQGNFLVYPDKPELVGSNQIDLKSLNGEEVIRQMVDLSLKQGFGFLSYLWNKPGEKEVSGEKLAYFSYIPKWGWIVGTGVYVDDINDIAGEKKSVILDRLKASFMKAVRIIIFFGLCLVVLTIGITRKMMAPLKDVALFAKELSAGNLGGNLEYSGNDEIGFLADSMRSASSDMTRLMRRLAKTSEAMTNSSAHLLTISEALSESSKKMESHSEDAAKETGSISEHMKNILGSNDNINAQLNRMAGFAETVSTNAGTVGEKIEFVSESTSTVACAIEEMYASFNEAAQNSSKGAAVTEEASRQAEETYEIMNQLNSSAREISEIIEIIQAIASQTHLLSLNAAIEAAGAGDAGKGFFVVANEVKALANQTESSANVIRSKILGMQEHAQKAVAVIQNIVKVISDIDKVMFAIASSVEEQTSVTNEISSNISATADRAKELNETAKENIAAVKQVAGDIEETLNDSGLIQRDVQNTTVIVDGVVESVKRANTSVKESVRDIMAIQDQSKDLARLAEDLKRVSRAFKL